MTEPLAQAQLGVELEVFKSSTVGQYFYERAHDDIFEATQALTTVSPDDVKHITELQNKVYRAQSFMTWIEQGIEEGNFAIQEMQEQ